MKPVVKQTAAHITGAGIQQGKQGGSRLAAQGLGDFQIAPSGGIHTHEILGGINLNGVHMADTLPLCQLGITKQRARRFQAKGKIITSETTQVVRGKLLAQCAPSGFRSKFQTGSDLMTALFSVG